MNDPYTLHYIITSTYQWERGFVLVWDIEGGIDWRSVDKQNASLSLWVCTKR